jgi:hypothetical protein
MSSAPSSAPSVAAAPEGSPAIEVPEIAGARKGFLRWIGATIKGTAVGLKNAIASLTVRPVAWTLRKTFNTVTWPLNYADRQWQILKNSPLGTGIAFGLDPKNYRLLGGGHGHGGGESDEGGGAHH